MHSGGEQQRSSGKRSGKKGIGKPYTIVVRGELSGRYAAAFEEMGMEMETQTGRTILTGVIDQPYLHGIFNRINALGLVLLSVGSCPKKNKKTEQAGSAAGDAAAAPSQGSRRT